MISAEPTLTPQMTPDRIEKIFDFSAIKDFPKKLQQQMVFIAEVDKLKNIFRRTLLTDGCRRENDAEHSWHLALMAIVLEEYAPEPVNLGRVLAMVTVHDLIEIYAGDTFAFDVSANQDKAQREQAAAEKLFGMLDEQQGSKLRQLWEEFDAMNTADARFAASLDRIQPFMHNVLTEGHTWKLGSVTKDQVYRRMAPVKTGTPALWPWLESQVVAAIEKGWIKEQ